MFLFHVSSEQAPPGQANVDLTEYDPAYSATLADVEAMGICRNTTISQPTLDACRVV